MTYILIFIPQINPFIYPDEWSFFLQKMVTNTESHKCQHVETKRLWVGQLKVGHLYHNVPLWPSPPPLKTQDPCGRVMILRTRENRGPQGSIIGWTRHSHCTHELRAPGIVYTRPAQASYSLSMDQGGAREVPPLAESPLFFLRNAGLAPVDGPTSYSHGPPCMASVC